MSIYGRVCTRCILDSSIPGISFDRNGMCIYCHIHDISDKQAPQGAAGRQILNRLVAEIKSKGRNHKYDCIVGVSGGADSTYTLYLCKQLGLRPLAVHLSNGWDSGIATSNIINAVTKLNVDLKTVTADWEEFKALQIAFLKASTPDMEIPSDHAIAAVLWRTAAAEKIYFVIHGHSFRTEGKIPLQWGYEDWRYIKSVYKKFGKTKRLKYYPKLSMIDYAYYFLVKRIKDIRLLNYIDYDKETVKDTLEKELGWQDYGTKHYESIYTRFIQSYVLPQKFNIDKRIIHLAALVRSGKLSKDEAIVETKKPPIAEEQAREDKKYIIEKLGLTNEEFEELFNAAPKTFLDYPTYYSIIKRFKVPMKWAYKLVSPTTPQFLLVSD